MPKSNVSHYHLFDNAPLPAAILNTEKLKLEMVNDHMLKLWDRSPGIINLPLLEFLPELSEQRYPLYLEEVIKTGRPIQEQAAKVLLTRSGKLESVFMDYSYTPLFGSDHKPNALLIMATDVCEREVNRLMVQQSRRDLRTLVMSAPIPMCVYTGNEFKVEAVNEHMLNLWQGDYSKPTPILNHVLTHGRPYKTTIGNIQYTFTPLGGDGDRINGVCVIASHT